jgi:hypothetical protein
MSILRHAALRHVHTYPGCPLKAVYLFYDSYDCVNVMILLNYNYGQLSRYISHLLFTYYFGALVVCKPAR